MEIFTLLDSLQATGIYYVCLQLPEYHFQKVDFITNFLPVFKEATTLICFYRQNPASGCSRFLVLLVDCWYSAELPYIYKVQHFPFILPQNLAYLIDIYFHEKKIFQWLWIFIAIYHCMHNFSRRPYHVFFICVNIWFTNFVDRCLNVPHDYTTCSSMP